MKFRGLDPRTRLVRWGLAAVAVGIVVGATAPAAIEALVANIMARPENLPWYAERLIGFLAYFALTGSVLYGLLLSTKILDVIAHRPITFTLHQDLASIGLGLAAIHGTLLALDHSMPFSLTQIVVPFAAPYQPFWVGVGQIAFYLSAAVVASFYLRRRIGQRAWRAFHYVTFLAFIGATAHGLLSGTDSAAPWAWARWIYFGSTIAVGLLLAYRILKAGGAKADRPVPVPVAADRPARRPTAT
jgi:predicted ferric reductase